MRSADDAEMKSRRPGQLTFELGHTPSLVEDDFIVRPGNKLAFEHVCAFPDWPGPLTLITGPKQSGKTHLAQIWMARSDAQLAAPSALEALATDAGVAPLVLEDVDRSDYDEKALFHLLNQSMRDGRPLLMTARKPVAEWRYATNDVLSRARLAAHFAVAMPDDTQLSQMFAKLFADRQIEVDAKVVAYLVARMERSAAEVNALVALMDEMALARRGPITRAIAADALEMRHNGTHESHEHESPGDQENE